MFLYSQFQLVSQTIWSVEQHSSTKELYNGVAAPPLPLPSQLLKGGEQSHSYSSRCALGWELGLSTRDPNDCTVWCTENRWANGTRCTWIALFTKSKNKIFLWSKLEKLHGHSECEWVQSKLMRIMGNKSLPVGKKSLIILMGSLWKRRHLVINYHYCAFTVNSTNCVI